MKFTVKRGVIMGAAAGVTLLAIGGTALAVTAGPDVADQVVSTSSAEAGHEGQGKYTAGGYRLQVHELTADGEGMGTGVEPNTTYYSKLLQGTESWKPTVVRFSVGDDNDGPIVYSYPIPADGKGIDCVASGTEAAPVIKCVTLAS
ncbi:hypothetical protein [Amycolatopsis sp. NPDC059657]|uniref:hypothetical protein n=1 Tax=Amycolatopsis sp. NPDC059657 TaxID=3346899 RepID=UPI003672E0B9